jgi:hypothetical protein
MVQHYLFSRLTVNLQIITFFGSPSNFHSYFNLQMTNLAPLFREKQIRNEITNSIKTSRRDYRNWTICQVKRERFLLIHEPQNKFCVLEGDDVFSLIITQIQNHKNSFQQTRAPTCNPSPNTLASRITHEQRRSISFPFVPDLC